MRQRVLLTGGSGLLALNWAAAIRNSHSVTLALHERQVSPMGVRTAKLDLGSVETVIDGLVQLEPQVVIHTAGLTNVEKCQSKPELARYVNVELATNVAKACARIGLPMVHISTDHLFSGEKPLADEDQPPAPINTYGKTKAEAESRVLDCHPGALVIRTNFYGWGTSWRKSFSDTVINGLRAGNRLTLFSDVFYTPILIETLVQAAHDLIAVEADGIFHVVGDERISKYAFGLALAEEFGLDKSLVASGSIDDCPTLVPRPHDMSLSNNKLRKLLGRDLGGAVQQISGLHRLAKEGLAAEMQRL
jgi:dTDP-4-dehydrorhamnose reductase